MYILDTDHFTLHVRNHEAITRRIMACDDNDVSISIVTVEETLTGWYTTLRQAKSLRVEIQAYDGMFRSMQALQCLQLIPFTPDALLRFYELRKTYRRLGRMDLAIAAICLEFDATLVTRNRIDFEQVAGLKIEDWSEPQVEGPS